MVEEIRTQQFDLILLNPGSGATFDPGSDLNRWPDPVLEEIERNYSPTHKFVCVDAELTYGRKSTDNDKPTWP